MMKMETLNIPRKLDDKNEMPDPNASLFTIKVKNDLGMVFSDGNTETVLGSQDVNALIKLLKPKLESQKTGTEKVVFVDFEDGVLWKDVVITMDSIRQLASDENHDEVKVALKVKEDPNEKKE